MRFEAFTMRLNNYFPMRLFLPALFVLLLFSGHCHVVDASPFPPIKDLAVGSALKIDGQIIDRSQFVPTREVIESSLNEDHARGVPNSSP